MRAVAPLLISLLLPGLGAMLGGCGARRASTGPTCTGDIVDGSCFEPGGGILGSPCGTHVDCQNTAACIEGTCQQECLDDWHCLGEARRCVHFQCVASDAVDAAAPPGGDAVDPPDAGLASDAGAPPDVLPVVDASARKACVNNFDCAGQGACITGFCDVQCTSDADCGDSTAWNCIQFQCWPEAIPDAVGPDTGPSDTAEPADAGPPDAGPQPDLPPGCTEKAAAYGDLCHCKSDCQSTLCLGDVAAGKGFCTKPCSTSANCPGIDWCLQAAPDAKVCVQNDAGAPCSQGCLFVTLQNQVGGCVCTVPCSSAAECPGTMACSAVPLNGVPTPLCVPVGQLCDPQKALPCYGTCFPDLSDTWLCTARCESFQDCPAGFQCYQEVISGQTVAHCLPN